MTQYHLDSSNANLGTSRGKTLLAESLREVGAGRSILVDKAGRVIAGNKTLAAWQEIGTDVEVVHTDGQKLVVVQRDDLDLDDPQGLARKLAYYDNRVNELDLQWDAAQILQDLDAGVDLSTLWDKDELDALIADVSTPIVGSPEEEPPEPKIDRAEELRRTWGVELGQIWSAGRHRIVCGDSTKIDDYISIVSQGYIEAIITDPPYGCTDYAWDRYVTQEELSSWLSKTTGPVVFFGAAPPNCLSAVLSLSPLPDRVYVWWNTFTLTNSEGAFWQWQPIYVWRKHAVQGIGKDVIDMAANTGGDKHVHVTQKPVLLLEKLIHAIDANAIYDPFLGSGTTLIACERLNRQCIGIEIDPGYVAVTLQRWADYTGETPQLEQSDG